MNQKFHAHTKEAFANGAIGWRNNSPTDCLGPYAKVQNCPIHNSTARLTCYATGYADTHFSIPACTRKKGKYVPGYFTSDEGGQVVFHPRASHKHLF